MIKNQWYAIAPSSIVKMGKISAIKRLGLELPYHCLQEDQRRAKENKLIVIWKIDTIKERSHRFRLFFLYLLKTKM